MTITLTKIRFQKDNYIIAEATSDGHTIVVTGNLDNACIGDSYNVDCVKTEHPRYGTQYNITKIHTSGLADFNVKTYLMSGAIVGCGPSTGLKIYNTFGDNSLDIIRNHHERLTEIQGISDKKALQIHNGEQQSKPESGLMGITGMTSGRAKKLYSQYGDNAFNILKATPYQPIYDIKGFSFKTVDEIALKGGLAFKDDPARIAAALTFILTDIEKEGHCYCGKPKLLERASDLLGINQNEVDAVLLDEIANGNIIVDGRSVYAKKVYDVECQTSLFVHKLSQQTPVLSSIQRGQINPDLAEEQKDAVIGALTNNIFAITGGAGTGKTTVINEITRLWKSETKRNVIMCAPTGKAARRMEEVTQCDAMTSARLATKHPHNSLIICDEASMLDIYMAHDLVRLAYEGSNSIIFVGDVNQLPPVGAGTFFKDILSCGYINNKKLVLCHRQFGTIAENAKKINEGLAVSSLSFDATTGFISVTEDPVTRAISEYKAAVQQYGIKNVCLLMPFRQSRGNIPSTEKANLILRQAYNTNAPRKGCKFADGDRVINLTNDAENDIANGDVGTVIYSSREDNIFKVEMDSGRTVTYPIEYEYQFDLAYALTIHKSQGSEYDCVIIVLTMAAFIMLERNLLYTAVTRGKKKVIMMGEKKAYGMAIKTQKAVKRNTKLADRIKMLATNKEDSQ